MKKTITRNQTSRNHRDQSDRVPERVLLARERYAARLSAQWRTVHGERSAQDCIAKLDVMKISCVSDPLAALRQFRICVALRVHTSDHEIKTFAGTLGSRVFSGITPLQRL